MKKIIIILIIVIAGYLIFFSDTNMITNTGDSNDLTVGIDFQMEAKLRDISGGRASGVAMAGYDTDAGFGANGKYDVVAKFSDLPELQDGYFYEGWLFNTADQNYVSTGRATNLPDGSFQNAFSSATNYSTYDTYILTLESENGGSEPEEYILEGKFK